MDREDPMSWWFHDIDSIVWTHRPPMKRTNNAPTFVRTRTTTVTNFLFHSPLHSRQSDDLSPGRCGDIPWTYHRSHSTIEWRRVRTTWREGIKKGTEREELTWDIRRQCSSRREELWPMYHRIVWPWIEDSYRQHSWSLDVHSAIDRVLQESLLSSVHRLIRKSTFQMIFQIGREKFPQRVGADVTNIQLRWESRWTSRSRSRRERENWLIENETISFSVFWDDACQKIHQLMPEL